LEWNFPRTESNLSVGIKEGVKDGLKKAAKDAFTLIFLSGSRVEVGAIRRG
jgi:hypothetical protein